MRTLRRLGYPLRLARVRLVRRAPAVLLAAGGVAAGAALLATVLAGIVIAREQSLERAVGEIPAAQRAVRASWFGLPAREAEGGAALDRQARDALAGAFRGEPAALVLFRESTIAGRFLGLGAVDGLGDWVTLRSGRLPRACVPERCEVVRLRGEGRIPSVPGLRLVEVGEATLASPVLFGDFVAPAEHERDRAALSPLYRDAVAYHRPPPAPLVLAEGVEGLLRSPELETAFGSRSWVVPLRPGTVRAWESGRFAGAVARARTSLQTASLAFELTAPTDELRTAAEAGDTAGRRLLLVGGQTAALLFAFALLTAVSMRPDAEAARRRLTWFGARRWQLGVFTGAEAAAVAAGGTLAGWGLGTLAGAAVAGRAGLPAGPVLSHSTLSETGLLVAAATACALALVLAVALVARPVAGGRLSALDVAALGASAVVGMLVLRGDLDGAALAREPGTAVGLVLLPGLVTFVAAVCCARLLEPALRGLERVARGRSTAVRLAALSLARHPGRAAVAAAFLLVTVGLAVFAESYRSTLQRAQVEQAAYAVPLDFAVRQDLTRLIRVPDVATPERLAALGPGVRAEPVLRLSANVNRAGGRTGITVLGLDTDVPPALGGWRSDFASLSPSELAARIAPAVAPETRGPELPPAATRLELEAQGVGVTVTASVETPRGDYAQLVLGEAGNERRVLHAPVPAAARGGRVTALTLGPPRIQERGADAGKPLVGELRLGLLAAAGPAGRTELGGFESWLGTGGVEPEAAAGGAALALTLTEQAAGRFRPEQPSDAGPVPVIASPAVAAAAGPNGELPLRIAGEQVLARVAAVAERFPGTRGDFAVADRRLLATAVNAERPGLAVAGELWLEAAPGRRETLAAALARPPFDVLAVESRARLERSLADDPLARGTLLTLLAGAVVALGLALAGILLGVASDIRDERGELDDLEREGARPALLRRVVHLRTGLVACFGLLGGLATAAVLGLLVTDLVAVTAEARGPELPLRAAVSWPLLAAALGAGALAAALLVALAARRV